VLDKATLSERFDEIVCDPRLRRDAILAQLESSDRGGELPDGHRAMASSGSTGRKSLFVYDRDGWATICAQFLRFNDWCGTKPRVPRLKVAAVVGGAPTHMSRRVAATLGVGLHRILPLAVTMPIPEIVARLRLAVRDGADATGTAERVHARLVERLTSLGVSEPAVEVELCERLARTSGGKLQMVVADRGAPAAT
jgi:hypothetical protein